MRDILQNGVSELELVLTEHQLNQLITLLEQLLKWNKAYNLTAITEVNEALKLHLLDSLAVVPYWHFEKTLDVGTGAGFPGLPLAIALPDQEFHLLDSNSKKVRFIKQQIHELGLTNVKTYHCRVQEHHKEEYDCVVSRAFASLKDMLVATEKQVIKSGRWMAMKGVYLEGELTEIPNWAVEIQCHQVKVPWLDAERCLIELARRND
ncbi:16S rRNA (guanine(527)-N(7))-methyltransferase RsmG [Aliikangiella sp. IMCC44359]|uniref:16S rRNA (guanine(527)-N(7))-methyltransferase RsmG n=1 Tax=Aliikangiella sp. IMCC44359 TaxID=3459125 RepID=UPI00403AA424